MKNSRLIIIIIIAFITLLSCDEDDNDKITNPIDLIVDDYDNIPVKVNTRNSYTFTVNANNFDYETVDELVFSDDSLVVTVTLTNSSSSNSSFTLFDDSNNEILSESLNENKVSVHTDITEQLPKRIQIKLEEFSGQLTIVVALEDE